MLFIGAFSALYATVAAQTKGSFGRLIQGIDDNLQVCGVDAGVEDKPYLFWCQSPSSAAALKQEVANGLSNGGVTSESIAAAAKSMSFGRSVCLESCPTADQTSLITACTAPVTIPPGSNQTQPPASSPEPYASQPLFHRYCIPDVKSYGDAAEKVLGFQFSGSTAQAMEFVSSMMNSWPAIVGALVFSIVLGYLYLFLIGHCSKCMIWMSILVTIGGFVALGAYLWTVPSTPEDRLPHELLWEGSDTDRAEQVKYYHIAAAVCWGIAFAACCVACFLCSSISVAAEAAEVACDAIFEMPSLLLAPAFKAVCKGSLAIFLLYGFLMLWSMGEIDVERPLLNETTISDAVNWLNGSHSERGAPHVTHTVNQQALVIFYMFVAFWIIAFAGALYQFVVAYAVATYYYEPHEHDEEGHSTDEKDVNGCMAALEGLHIGLMYHSGSLAMGSALIAILQVIQKVIEYAQTKNKEAGENKLVECILASCACCIHCLKDIVGFINKNAYIDIAVTSNGFCTAAKRSLQIVIEMGSAMAILNGATCIFAFFGTAVITLLSAFAVSAASQCSPFTDVDSPFYIADPLAAALVAAIIGFLVALSFMDVFDMASDTLLYCYGVDHQRGGPGHNIPKGLKDMMARHDHGHD